MGEELAGACRGLFAIAARKCDLVTFVTGHGRSKESTRRSRRGEGERELEPIEPRASWQSQLERNRESTHRWPGTRKRIHKSNRFAQSGIATEGRAAESYRHTRRRLVCRSCPRTVATRLVFASSTELPQIPYTTHRAYQGRPCLRARGRRRRPRPSCPAMRHACAAMEIRSYRPLSRRRIRCLRRA